MKEILLFATMILTLAASAARGLETSSPYLNVSPDYRSFIPPDYPPPPEIPHEIPAVELSAENRILRSHGLGNGSVLRMYVMGKVGEQQVEITFKWVASALAQIGVKPGNTRAETRAGWPLQRSTLLALRSGCGFRV
jgi:hypothetical protein